MKKVYIASDHAGFSLKTWLIEYLGKQGHELRDLGPENAASCDYPNSARKVAEQVQADPSALGILICGTGIGMSMAANRFPGVRAALATHESQARMTRAHNNANVLCLGEWISAPGLAGRLADLFLSTEFEGGRHQRRVDLFDPRPGC